LLIKIGAFVALLASFAGVNMWQTALAKETELLEARQNEDKPDK
jgi:hypothetical protein